MKFTTSTKSVEIKQLLVTSVEQVSSMYDELLVSYMNLSDAERGMESVCEIINNINTSIALLKDCGTSVISGLNNDSGLEALMGISEKLITAEKAIEALEQEKKSAFEKFKEFVSNAFKFVADFIGKIVELVKQIFVSTKDRANTLVGALSTFDKSVSAQGLVYREAFEIPLRIRNSVVSQMEKISQYAEAIATIVGMTESDSQEIRADLVSMFKKISDDAMGVVTFDEANDKLKFAGLNVFLDEMQSKGLLGTDGATLESLKYSDGDIKAIAKQYADYMHQFDTFSQKWKTFCLKRQLSKAQFSESRNLEDQAKVSFNFAGQSTCVKMICSILLVSEQLNAAVARYMAKHINVFYKAYQDPKF